MDVEVVFCGKTHWMYVMEKALLGEALVTRSERRAVASVPAAIADDDQDVQRKHVVLAYIFTSIETTCESIVRQIGCPAKGWKRLKENSKALSETVIGAKLILLKFIQLQKRKKFIEYSNQIIEKISELGLADYTIGEIERKWALLCEIPIEYHVTVELIMLAGPSYQDAVSILVAKEMRLKE